MHLHRSLFAAVALLALTHAHCAPTRATISRPEFRDRVYACFLGKNIGGTLGMPVEGNRETHDWTFYTPVPTEPAANDDIDLQLLWLKALQERGPGLTSLDLGEYWLQYVPVNWNEYGVGKANMRDGFPPPISGQIRNQRWRDSNGAWIRSEVWACVAPGCPWIAARYAWEDACVDHGTGEGTWAEMFTAAVESAAFIESDRDKLIDIGLSYIPEDCALRRSIDAALAAYEGGLDLMAAREAVVKASASTGWFMAPQNVAFVVLGWLYGEGDFGRSICAAVNCGDDTDCTGATLGSILGIIGGTAGIPDEWRKPVGERIRNVAIGGFTPPGTIGELTEQVVAMAPSVLRANGVRVGFRPGPSERSITMRGSELRRPDVARALWARSPYTVRYHFLDCVAALSFGQEPILDRGQTMPVELTFTNGTDGPREVSVEWRTGEALSARPTSLNGTVAPGQSLAFGAAITREADEVETAVLRCTLCIKLDNGEFEVPVCFLAPVNVRRDDVALASKGATATSDSELDREKGCTSMAIDGIIPAADDFEAKRWHAALTPHPHRLAIDLGQARTISRVIVHFADPAGHPVDFDGESSDDGVTWKPLFQARGHADTRRYDTSVTPTAMRHFRLTIHRSASDVYRDAAQVGEVELIGE